MWPSLTRTSWLPVEYNSTAFVGNYLKSCPDCLVWMDTMTNNEKGRSLYIFSELTAIFFTFTKIFLHYRSLIVFFPRPQQRTDRWKTPIWKCLRSRRRASASRVKYSSWIQQVRRCLHHNTHTLTFTLTNKHCSPKRRNLTFRFFFQICAPMSQKQRRKKRINKNSPET